METEGPAGFYRGVLPRVCIYLTQGAVFFAAYELMKRLLLPRVGEAGSEGEGPRSKRRRNAPPLRL